MRDGFARFRIRILRALHAADPVGLDDHLLLRVLDVGRRRPGEKHVAGALAYLARARLITREREADDCAPISRLTNKGAALFLVPISHPQTRGRRSRSPAAAAPPPRSSNAAS